MGKLVRDGIPGFIERDGRSANIRVLENDEFDRALREKLVEESNEAKEADSTDLLMELGDVLEVLMSIAAANGHSFADVDAARLTKLHTHGAFTERIFLE